MQLPYSDEIDVGYLGRLFDNTSECYKFFWFQAIVTKVLEGKDTFSYNELIDEMIAEAWYMVTEYHLSLGPRDSLEKLIHHIQAISDMKPCESKKNIIKKISENSDAEVKKIRRDLIRHVPYRLQAPFMNNFKGKDWKVKESQLVENINRQSRLMYYFIAFNGIETQIKVQPEWCLYICENQEIIKGWLRYNMITYLQRRNPSVPGIADKLYPPTERKLEKVKKYWKLLIETHQIREIYSCTELDVGDISIDHFVPWSYVAHDEFWNLHPTTKGINSSKGNNLPDWNIYFPRLVRLEYMSYEMMWKNERIMAEFKKCAREHLNSDEVRMHIYKEGMTIENFDNALKEVIYPVYMSAKNCGFNNWVYREN